MVFTEVSERERPHKFMAMAPERSRPLHNFDMPCLRWGNQRVLRCMKVNSNGEISPFDRRLSPSSEAEYEDFIGRRRESNSTKQGSSNGFGKSKKLLSPPIGAYGEKSEIDGDVDDGIEEVREKLMSELRTAANKINVAIPEEGEEDESFAAAARPWNLRKRRAACTAPNDNGRGVGGGSGLAGCSNSKNEERQQNTSPPRNENSTIKSLRVRFSSPAQGSVGKKEIPKFSIPLSRQEIEDDFFSMTGARPPRRSRKRTRNVQKQLETTFPGLWLSEITLDSYKVPDTPEPGKR
ncbi:uncharacterized protein LOC122074157 [Macadamia integrifolia]|uniref:uncharacterized protein LOC122074157 n=1 Tax=Macadamia integrifolia TaxID=60698 RepID=UPI001C4E7834|nr:uncharacterized protein LOC122074157 [Macadamia integrifolia]